MSTRLSIVALALALGAGAGCGTVPFEPEGLVSSVRVLAVRASHPYAKPGDAIDFDLLAYDGRANKPRPMRLFWLPTPCVNPEDGVMTGCYPRFAGMFPKGVDLTGELASGSSFSAKVPVDALGAQGAEPRLYGTMFVFQMACAGHVQYIGDDAAPSPESVPFGCFDEAGRRLGSEDFMFSYATVFVVPTETNANPSIDGLTFDDEPIDDAGITVVPCATSDVTKCPTYALDVAVTASSQEPDPTNLDPSGAPLGERVWVHYYLTEGTLARNQGVLYDPAQGKLDFSATTFLAPQAPGEGRVFVVVHDNRGGVDFREVPLHVK